jgi:class 3 adenylate cyclase/predicted ATPase
MLDDRSPRKNDRTIAAAPLRACGCDFAGVTAVDIAAWLRSLGLERYAPAFEANDIDSELLPKLTADDLIGLGVTSIGHRRKLLEAIAALMPRPAPSDLLAEAASRRGAERRQLTVMFVDLVGSTALAARLDPEDMGAVIRDYHGACAQVVERWGGHVAKYMGDGVLAYFGWPQAHEDEAERAVRAGLELVEAVSSLEPPGMGLRGGWRLAARVGIATGLVMVGELIGEGAAREEAVVGETPNLAARLQALAAPGSIVISQTTRRLIGELFELAVLGPRRLKGFAEPLAAFRVEGEGRAEGRFEALHGERLTPLVGREEELHLLLSRWRRAKAGEGQVVLLSGEPGVGKSRIVRALRERLADEAYTPLSHYCSPYHSNSALYPVIGLLERAAGFTRDDTLERRLGKLEALLTQGTARVGEAVPLVAALLSIPSAQRYPPLNLTAERQKQRTFEVLLEQLEGLAAREAVLTIYEDLHWADPSTLELLGAAVDRVQELPVLMVMTFRPEFAAPWTGHAHVAQLSLSRLTRRHGEAMVGHLTGGKPLPQPMVDQIVAKTDGVPLFVEELTKAVLETGLVTDAGDRYGLSGPLPPLAVPATLRDSLMARLDRLAPVKEVAQVASVIGREFSHELLTAVADRREVEINDALDRLVASELIFRRGTLPAARYSFKHALVQDAAYQSLLRSRRQQLHAKIAAVMEQRFSDIAQAEPELLAHHFTEAGLAEDAARYWLRAGWRAAEQSANLEAVAHLSRGLELVRTLPESEARDRLELDLLVALGPALVATKGFAAPENETLYLRARDLCARTAETARLFAVVWGLWMVHQHTSRLPQARSYARDLLEVAERSGDRGFLLQAHHSAWTTLFVMEELEPALEHTKQGMALYEFEAHRSHAFLYGGHDPGVCCRMIGALVNWLLGFPDQARILADQSIELGRRLDHPFSLGMALSFATSVHKLRREPEVVAERAAAFLELLATHGMRLAHFACTATMLAGWALAACGEMDKGVEQLRAGLAELRATGWGRLTFQLTLLVEGVIRAGNHAAGLEAIEEALSVIEATGERLWEAEVHRLRGELLTKRPEPDHAGAEASFQCALEAARRQDARSFELRAATSLARLWAEQGKRTEARELLAPVYGWFTEGFDTADLRDAKALLDELQ